MKKTIKRIEQDPMSVTRVQFNINTTEIPASLAKCKNLQSLKFLYSEVKEIPDFVSKLPALKTLEFTGCEDLKFPTNLAAYPALKILGVYCNNKKELEKVFQLDHLEGLIISGNIKQVPESIVQLQNLKALSIFHLPFTRVPKALAELPDLSKLELTTEDSVLDFEQVAAVLKDCKKLTDLEINGYPLTLSKSISKISRLKKLTLSQVGLTSLPAEIFDLGHLTELDLSVNRIKKFPKGISKLKNLKFLDFRSNFATKAGTKNLMNEIHLLPSLQQLILSYNQVDLPESIIDCKKLKTLNLSDMKLKSLPEAIYQMTWLKKLILSDNKFPKGTGDQIINSLPDTKVQIENDG